MLVVFRAPRFAQNLSSLTMMDNDDSLGGGERALGARGAMFARLTRPTFRASRNISASSDQRTT